MDEEQEREEYFRILCKIESYIENSGRSREDLLEELENDLED